jgi:hypothetical protein
MYFRFRVTDDNRTVYTQWQEEAVTYGEYATAVQAMKQLRAANPTAAISIERNSAKPDSKELNGG